MSKDRIVCFRLTSEEYGALAKRAKSSNQFRRGSENFSEFVRDILFSQSGYKNKSLEKKLSDVQMEIRKIGVNVNQIARKINSGFGNHEDVLALRHQLVEIEKVFEKFSDEVMEEWQSPD